MLSLSNRGSAFLYISLLPRESRSSFALLRLASLIMAAPLDRQHSNTLTRTLTQDSSNPSDFLLLTSARASTLPAYSLPRPRFLPVLVGAAVLDLAWTISQGALLAREGKTGGLWVAVAVSLMRPLLVLSVVMSVRVRERSVWILGQLMVSYGKLHTLLCT